MGELITIFAGGFVIAGTMGGLVSWLSLRGIYQQINELRAELDRLKAKHEGK